MADPCRGCVTFELVHDLLGSESVSLLLRIDNFADDQRDESLCNDGTFGIRCLVQPLARPGCMRFL